jgi:hypothetical protein
MSSSYTIAYTRIQSLNEALNAFKLTLQLDNTRARLLVRRVHLTELKHVSYAVRIYMSTL